MKIFRLFLLLIGLLSSSVAIGQEKEIQKLEKESMLFQAGELAKKISGEKEQWHYPYAQPAPSKMCVPRPEKACKIASVWFAAYPFSMIVPSEKSVLKELASNQLWEMFEEIGIDAMHTGPLKLAGQLVDGQLEPSVDGGYDRIGYAIDPLFGTQYEYLEMVKVANNHNAIISGDLVPGHTGKGPDFVLATMDYKDYPGIYHMVEIAEKDWNQLPDVPKNQQSVNLKPAEVDNLKKLLYIIGRLDKINLYDPNVKVTNWSVTKEIVGADGEKHRWAYLHLFKAGQPSFNWLDPSFGANRIVAGDVIISLGTYKNKILRLDASAFLGEEIVPGKKESIVYGHPLSIIASDIISMFSRKLGGFTFQELDGSIKMMKTFMKYGPDLTYDFITRGAYVHALAFSDADILRFVGNLMLKENLSPKRLIHALQNHDEFNVNYNFLGLTPDQTYTYKGQSLSGKDLKNQLKQKDFSKLTGPSVLYNASNDSGITSTLVGLAAASLGIGNVYEMTQEEKKLVKNAHLLLTFYNAMQPGVFAISGWDLVGALPLKKEEVQELLKKDGDNRWLNRGAYDLLGQYPEITDSVFGIPRAKTLYNPIPIQLREPCSYVSLLKKILKARKAYNIPQATLLELPKTASNIYLAFYRLPKTNDVLMIALNFSTKKHVEAISSSHIVGKEAFEIVREKPEEKDKEAKQFQLSLGPLQAKAILFK